MANALAREQSPYLLQHAENPVHWRPWGEDAFQRARKEDKPVFLSVGYATCHWCHVMAHESFEDEEVAKLLNEHYVSVKVDREERPDVDSIYMTVCQALTGHGGWPLSVFMTPDKKPFYAGTYFPKNSRMGMPGFMDILSHIANLWESHRDRVLQVSDQVTQAVQPKAKLHKAPLSPDMLEKGYRQLESAFDPKWGGFGKAPKFPSPHHLTFLLRYHKRNPRSRALEMVETTLENMRMGGIFDHVGLGFSRYSVDEKWLVPHFEKMLYDQAMLAMAYTEAFQLTGKEFFARVAREIFQYVLRDMRSPGGGFYSAEDADSEGEEGKFYVWSAEEVKSVLGEESGNLFCRFYDITGPGNFEGKNIPHVTRSVQAFAQSAGLDAQELEKTLEEGRRKLFEVREQRIHPLKDDKVLTSWNGLMIAALAKGYQALQEPAYLEAASAAAGFVLESLRREDGRLLRRYRNGQTAHDGYLDDYAFFIWGLLELYECAFHTPYLKEALSLQNKMGELFRDEKDGGFFFTPQGGEEHIVRDKDIYDGAVPSGNSVAALNLIRLARMTGDPRREEEADETLETFSGMVSDYPMAYTQYLNALDFAMGPAKEIVVVGTEKNPSLGEEMIRAIQRTFLPNRVLLRRKGEDQELSSLAPYTAALKPVEDGPTVYVCEKYACRSPVNDLEALRSALT